MAKLDILTFPDPRLRKKSTPVDQVTDELRQFTNDMLETMYASRGIGLAAPQVNRLDRVVVIDTRPKDEEGRYDLSTMTELEKAIEQPLILINPEVTAKDGMTTYDEGCLSVPSYFETVQRAEHISVKMLNLDGEEVEFEVDGLLAICIQHEIDHLDGKLFIDRLSTIKSNRIKSKIKKFGYPEADEDEEEENSSSSEARI
tara:strand:+ start:154724 stop:155326 length:603 start_codon:yes stop_codon:yes gene_type:complete